MSRLSDLKLALTLKLADRVTAPSRRVSSSVQQMSSRLQQTRAELKAINEQSRKVDALAGLGTRFRDTENKLSAAQQRFRDLQRQYNASANPSKRLQSQLESAGRRVGQLSQRHTQLRKETGTLRKELRAAGIDTARLGQAKARLTERSTRLTEAVEKQRHGLSRLKQLPHAVGAQFDRLRGAGARLGRALAWTAGIGAAGLAGGAALGAPMVGIAAESERLQAQIFAVEGSAERARSAMQWVHRFHESTPFELGKVTQAFVELRNEGLDPTQGMLKSVANAGAALGGDITAAADAVLGAMHGRTRALRNLGIAAQRRDDLMEFRYIDREGNERVLSALADDRAMIAGAVQRILDDKFTGTLEHFEATWDGIWGNTTEHWTRFRRMIMDSGPFEVLKGRMAGVLDRLDAMVESGEMEALAERIGGELITLIDRIGDLGDRAGAFMGDMKDHATSLAEFVGGWRNLAGILVGLKLVGVGSALLSVISALNLIVSLAGPLATVTAIMAKFSLVLLANPVTWIVAAIAGALALLGGAAYLVYKNWDLVTAVTSHAWTAIKDGFRDTGEWITDWFRSSLVGQGVSEFGEAWEQGWRSVLAKTGQVLLDWSPLGLLHRGIATILNYFNIDVSRSLTEAGRNLIGGLLQGISDRWDEVKQRILSLSDMLPEWLRNRLDIRSPSRVMAEIGGHISDGVGVGIEQRAGRALAAVRRLGDRLPGALPTAMAVGLAASGGVQAAHVPAMGMGGAPVVIHEHNTIHIHVPAGSDAHDIAAAVERVLEQRKRQAGARARSRLYDED